MSDQTSDPAQDAGLTSPPIQGVDEGVVKSGDEETAHVPITTPPEEVQQGQGEQTQQTEQSSEQTQSSETDQSAGGIITRELTHDTAEQMKTPVDHSGGTPTDATGDKSKNLA